MGDVDLLAAQRRVFESALKTPTKMVALALLDHHSTTGRVFPSIPRLSQWTGLGERAVKVHLALLERSGFIAIQKESGKSNNYQLIGLMRIPPAKRERQAPRSKPNQGTTCTSALDAPVHEMPLTRALDAPEPVHEMPPKEPIEGTQEGTQSVIAHKRDEKSAKRKSSKEAKAPPHPHANELKVFYLAEFERLRGTTPGFSPKDWGRAMKSFGELADKVQVDRAKNVITNALASAFAHRVQPWDLSRDCNNYLGAKQTTPNRGPYRQSGAEFVTTNRSEVFE